MSKLTAKPKPAKPKKKKSGLDYIIEPLRHLAVPIDNLKPDSDNARHHTNENRKAIRASLKKFGQRLPILVEAGTNRIVAGNGRWREAKQLGWSHMAAIVHKDAKNMLDAFAIMDNRTAELAEWDQEALLSIFKDDDMRELMGALHMDYFMLGNGKTLADSLDDEINLGTLDDPQKTKTEIEVDAELEDEEEEFDEGEEYDESSDNGAAAEIEGLTFGVLAKLSSEKKQKTLIGKLRKVGIDCEPMML